MNKNYHYLFKTKRFLPLFLTQLCSAFNDNLLKNSLIILVTYKLSESLFLSSGFIVLLANALFILPYILFAGIAGQVADKYEASVIIKIVKFSEIIISIISIYGFVYEDVTLLLILICCMGIHSTFFGPVKYSILPDYLKRDELLSANGYIEGATFLSILLGSLFGGLYIQASYFVIFIMLLTSIIGFTSSFYIPKSKNFNIKLKINKNIFQEIFIIMKYAQSRRNIFLCILGISWFWFLGATILSQVPLLAKDVLYSDYGVSNLFLATFSFGVLTGSVLCNKIISNEITAKYLFISAIGISIFGIDLYFACKNCHSSCEVNSLRSIYVFLSSLKSWRILVDLFCISSITGIYAVPLYAVIQHYSPISHRSRIVAANNVYNAIFMIASCIFLSTLFALNFTVPTIILLISIANIGVAIFILSFTPEVRLMPDPIMKWLFNLIFNFFYKVEISGIENYHEAGERVVIIANHSSYLDSALLSVYLPQKPVFAIDTNTANKWWVKIFLNYTKTYNIDNINAFGIKPLINSVKNGKKIAIFPEGRLSSTGSLMKIYEGPGMIADKADAMILPIMIKGAQYTHFSRLKNLPRRRIFTKIIINILPPIKITPPSNLNIRDRRKYIAESLYKIMSNMVFESSNYNQTIYQSLIDMAKIVGFGKDIYRDMDNTKLTFRGLFKENFLISKYVLKTSQNTDNIGLLLPNYAVYFSLFFAFQSVGKVPLLINPELDIKYIIENCKNAGICSIFSSRRYIEASNLNQFIEELRVIFNIIYIEDIASNFNLNSIIKAYILSYFPQLTYDKLSLARESNNIAILIFDSDNYNSPKLVALTHTNILSNIAQVKARIDFKIHDIAFNSLPIYNYFGLSSTLMMTLSGIETLLYHTPTHYRIIPEMIYMYDITMIFSTNILLMNYAKSAHPYDFSSVRYVFCCNANLSNYTRKLWMENYGIKIYENYGKAEASSFLSFNTPMHNKSNSQGRFLPGIEYKIQEISFLKNAGRLFLKGANISPGYIIFNNQIQKIGGDEICRGWFDSGDIASIDSDEYLTIHGSIKRYIKINNEYISLYLVENVASQIDSESENSALFISSTESIVLFSTSQIIDNDLYKDYLIKNNYSLNLLPKIFKKLKYIPTTDSGEYSYQELLKVIEDS